MSRCSEYFLLVKKAKRAFSTAAIVGAALVIILGFFFPAYTKVGEHCDYTGSTRSWIRLPLGLRVNKSYEKSPLESHIEDNYPKALEHRWISYQGTQKNLYGATLVMGHGRPNELFLKSDFFLKWFVDEASPDEIRDSYDVLRTAPDDEVRRKIGFFAGFSGRISG